jgi:hypothetical protein
VLLEFFHRDGAAGVAEPVVEAGADVPVLPAVLTEPGFQNMTKPASNNRTARAPSIHPMFEPDRFLSISFLITFPFIHMQR